MPELPEAETLRRDIDAEFGGRLIESVRATGLRSVRRHLDPAEFETAVKGRRLTRTGRRGKYILLHLDGAAVVVAHMGMSGQMLLAGGADPVAKHTHVVLGFEGGVELRFVDPRTFGQMFVTTASAGGSGGAASASVAELEHLGFDPFEVSAADRLRALVGGRTTRLKPLLMDQRRIAGIGNMYADEILYRAGLRPDRPALTLGPADVDRLYAAMVAVLEEGIEMRGSSLADEQYRDLYGALGRMQTRHRVYDREGQPCVGCGGPIARLKAQGRSSFFCPVCQA